MDNNFRHFAESVLSDLYPEYVDNGIDDNITFKEWLSRNQDTVGEIFLRQVDEELDLDTVITSVEERND